MPAEQQTLQQLEQMRQIGSQLKQQIDRSSSVLGANNTPGPDRGGDMSADNLNDPMQHTT
ncbi:hypothetical protein [Effusibacillus pohliae]|uniref:hypothetical protein n=1 Tax=Effusibacillus pohliae TaxID=232270 RepID=UPI000371AD44|nr:hypothetical protein [Effusibacillus pohliae]